MNKITFRVLYPETREPGDNVITKILMVKKNGVRVGLIRTRISDANQSMAEPGYIVTAYYEEDGREQKMFYENSGTFSNRSLKEAKENLAEYVREIKEKIKEHYKL